MERGLSVSIGVFDGSLFEEATSGGLFLAGAGVDCAAVEGGGVGAAVDVESTILMGTRLLFADDGGFEDGVGAGGTDLGYVSIDKLFGPLDYTTTNIDGFPLCDQLVHFLNLLFD